MTLCVHVARPVPEMDPRLNGILLVVGGLAIDLVAIRRAVVAAWCAIGVGTIVLLVETRPKVEAVAAVAVAASDLRRECSLGMDAATADFFLAIVAADPCSAAIDPVSATAVGDARGPPLHVTLFDLATRFIPRSLTWTSSRSSL